MTTDDYDTLIEKGWTPFLMSYLPRVIDPQEFQQSMGWLMANTPRIQQTYRDHGYVVVCDAPVNVGIPFEYLCGGRSMTKFIFDLHRMPNKVQAAMDVIVAEQLAQIRAAPRLPGIGGTWLGGWRAASALISPKLWNRFVWPYYLQLVQALIGVGITPVLHWDQNWTRDLVRLFGSTGLILCPGCDAPINTKPENMEAFVAASLAFGKTA